MTTQNKRERERERETLLGNSVHNGGSWARSNVVNEEEEEEEEDFFINHQVQLQFSPIL